MFVSIIGYSCVADNSDLIAIFIIIFSGWFFLWKHKLTIKKQEVTKLCLPGFLISSTLPWNKRYSIKKKESHLSFINIFSVSRFISVSVYRQAKTSKTFVWDLDGFRTNGMESSSYVIYFLQNGLRARAIELPPVFVCDLFTRKIVSIPVLVRPTYISFVIPPLLTYMFFPQNALSIPPALNCYISLSLTLWPSLKRSANVISSALPKCKIPPPFSNT